MWEKVSLQQNIVVIYFERKISAYRPRDRTMDIRCKWYIVLDRSRLGSTMSQTPEWRKRKLVTGPKADIKSRGGTSTGKMNVCMCSNSEGRMVQMTYCRTDKGQVERIWVSSCARRPQVVERTSDTSSTWGSSYIGITRQGYVGNIHKEHYICTRWLEQHEWPRGLPLTGRNGVQICHWQKQTIGVSEY